MSRRYKVEGILLEDTGNALLVAQRTSKKERKDWIPRSQCDRISKGPVDQMKPRSVTVICNEWIAKKIALKSEEVE